MGAYQTVKTESSDIRARLDHPVVDADGHIHEADFVVQDFLKQIGGSSIVQRYIEVSSAPRPPGRPKSLFWGSFSGDHTIDRATTMLPRLYASRLDEAGIDFSTLYSTLGFRWQVHPDEELRRAVCRAFNMMYAEMFSAVSRRMTPAALIPMHTPQEGIDELEFAVGKLGMKAIMTCNEVLRPNKLVASEAPALADRVLEYTPLAIDSPFDYDPFWAKCLELKVVPAGHSMNFSGWHASPSNYVYNRLGFFASYSHAAARALFLGGVTQRFPKLNIAFLEGGVWWAVSLYNDLFEFWEKRNPGVMLDCHDPAKIDFALMEEMFREYGTERLTAERLLANRSAFTRDGRSQPGETPGFVTDDWRHLKINDRQDIRDAFVDNFYFGCEADDAMNYTAFNSKANKMGAKLKAVFSSDIGHWDVLHFGGILAEAHKQVDRGLMSSEDFRDFVFTNPITMQARVNPDYFKGTVVEEAVEQLLATRSETGGKPLAA